MENIARPLLIYLVYNKTMEENCLQNTNKQKQHVFFTINNINTHDTVLQNVDSAAYVSRKIFRGGETKPIKLKIVTSLYRKLLTKTVVEWYYFKNRQNG